MQPNWLQMKYQVTITETLSRKISVEAPTAEIAEEQVRGLYRDEDIVLGSSDFCYFNVDVCGEEAKPFYLSQEGDFSLYYGDCMELLPLLGDKVDMVFADPPYFLSNGGISVQSGKIVSVNKGEWDKGIPVDEMHAFNMKWIGMCRDVLTDNGTIGLAAPTITSSLWPMPSHRLASRYSTSSHGPRRTRRPISLVATSPTQRNSSFGLERWQKFHTTTIMN